MALPHLSDDEIRTWTPEQKDRWWLENVFRGNMPQLTLRAAITGFFLGGVLSATNLYIGAKTGWTLGVGVTSVILSFVMFRAISKLRVSSDMTILENNAVQSIATAAGYMTGPIISALMAYMFVTNTTMEWYKMLVWNVVASILGVLVAFPMKRRFINDEQQPFPEGRACAVVLDSLYPDAPQGGTKNMVDGTPVVKPRADGAGGVDSGLFKAKALAVAATIGAVLQFLIATGYLAMLQIKGLGIAKAVDDLWLQIPGHIDDWYYRLADKMPLPTPGINGIPLPQLGVSFAFDLSMIGAGGLMGMRIATSVVLGMLVNFLVVAPLMVSQGEILPKNLGAIANPDGSYMVSDAIFGRPHLTNTWCLWWGVAMMVTASMVGLFAKPKMIISAFTGLFSKKEKREDCLKDIEFPLKWSIIGIPIASAAIIYINHEWFGVDWWIGALSIPLIIVLTLIAANATALTSTTPTGSLSKITQFTFGALQPSNPATNLMTAGVTTEVASNASNLLMDIKPGYMLGAKPRQQAIGHVIGIVAGALASTPLFYLLFMWTRSAEVPIEQHVTETWAVPGAVQWAAISKVIEGMGSGGETMQIGADGVTKMWGVLPASAAWAMVAGAAIAIVFELLRIGTKGRFPLSAVGIGLGVVLPPDSTIMMFAGAVIFGVAEWLYHNRLGTFGWRLWVDSKEAVCAGLIAGWALLGIGDGIIAAVAKFPESKDAVVATENEIGDLEQQLGAAPTDLALMGKLGTLLVTEPLSTANEARGRQLLADAADKGDASAAYQFGRLHEADGKLADAATRYRAAATGGVADAAGALVDLYAGGFDNPESGAWLEAQAAGGSGAAARVLGARALAAGDRERALALYADGAAKKDAQSAWKLCELKGSAEPLAIADLWLAAAGGGARESAVMLDAVAPAIIAGGTSAQQADLAKLLTNGKAGRIDMLLARSALENAVKADPTLEAALAAHYMSHSPTREGDAAKIMAKLAAAGDVAQAVALGELIARVSDQPVESKEVLDAIGATDGRTEAKRLWTEAANKGNAQAMFDLGWQAHDGWGMTADVDAARSWWKQAAERGNPRAMYRVGLLLAGSTSAQDRLDGVFWLRLAASKGAVGAQRAADRASFSLSDAEQYAIDTRLTEWKPVTP